MAKMTNLGVASRFALLKIDDDDSDDEGNEQRSMGQNKKSIQGKTNWKPISGAAAIGVNVNSQKNKKKSIKKIAKPMELDGNKGFDENVFDEQNDLQETLRMSQITFEREQARRRQLYQQEEEGTKKAIEESTSERDFRNEEPDIENEGQPKSKQSVAFGASLRNAAKGENGDKANEEDSDFELDLIVNEIAAEEKQIKDASKGRRQAGESANDALSKLYKSKLEQVAILAKERNSEVKKLKKDLDKVKTRYNRFCEVLADTETREKAQLAVEKKKAMKLNDELTQQMTEMHKELEQARSRIHELENEQKKHTKSNK